MYWYSVNQPLLHSFQHCGPLLLPIPDLGSCASNSQRQQAAFPAFFPTLQTSNPKPCCPHPAWFLLQAPAKDSKQLFLQFAALEETYGLARSAMEVYDKAVRTVVDKERFEVYTLYLARATQFFGVGKVNL